MKNQLCWAMMLLGAALASAQDRNQDAVPADAKANRLLRRTYRKGWQVAGL
ncbi:MAG: hypothetical protein NT105_08740 [Verrucomicrobia bacterium]|nr:hypothetical protein [Verrucomicrobiota bacterium]